VGPQMLLALFLMSVTVNNQQATAYIDIDILYIKYIKSLSITENNSMLHMFLQVHFLQRLHNFVIAQCFVLSNYCTLPLILVYACIHLSTKLNNHPASFNLLSIYACMSTTKEYRSFQKKRMISYVSMFL
jgi:hypothetical protein